MTKTHEEVQEYYGKTLQQSTDLKTNACCTTVSYPDNIKNILKEIHDEVLIKYYGCGLTIPHELTGLNVLDLGSGSGRDCFIASKLVGEKGNVIGIDMTDEQLEIANKYIDYHTDKFNYKSANTKFLKGHIEEIDTLEIKDDSQDVIISNCVINLSTNKKKVLKDCYSKLKTGGEMYFSDVYVNKRIPEILGNDPVIYGECLGGALYWNDFQNMAKEVGFSDPRVVEASPITIENKEIQGKLAGFEFYSITYRLFKISELEPDCEDYGQAVIYNGGIENAENAFMLDQGHLFQKGKVEAVCGNTYLMLKNTRFEKYFTFIGDFETHYGIFPGCGNDNPFSSLHTSETSSEIGCC